MASPAGPTDQALTPLQETEREARVMAALVEAGLTELRRDSPIVVWKRQARARLKAKAARKS